jgi:rhamnulokinase
MPETANFLAYDLGASGGRAMLGRWDGAHYTLEELHRFENGPVAVQGSLHWDALRLWTELKVGMARYAEQHTQPLSGIGVDTWGVDYGLLGDDGALLSPPHAYRSERTASWREVVDRIGEDVLYETTGIQLMQINTIFQLAAHDRDELARARRLLMLPELVVHALTGSVHGEVTSAGTSALVDLRTGTWSPALLDAVGVDPAIMPTITRAPAAAGTWRGIPVHLVGGHDTASAVAAMPVPGAAFVSSGTWMLVGIERPSAVLGDVTFSNEPGVAGGVRLLKNVMGLWMLERCRAQWGEPPLDDLLRAAGDAHAPALVDARDPRFLDPDDMEAEVRAAARLPATAGRDVVARCILDSLAASTAEVLGALGATEVCVLGGGAQNALLNRLVADASGLPLTVGPVEATALGNALVQGIALGVFADLAEGRAQVRARFAPM